MKTQFPLYLLEQFTFDIFGSQKTVGESIITTKPLLSQNLLQPIKIHLKRLGNKLLDEKAIAQEQRTALINEFFGEDKKLKEGLNEENFSNKMKELFTTEIELGHYEFKLEDFNFQGEEIYEIIDFLTKEKEEN